MIRKETDVSWKRLLWSIRSRFPLQWNSPRYYPLIQCSLQGRTQALCLSRSRLVLSVSLALMTNQASVIERHYCRACSLVVSVCMCVVRAVCYVCVYTHKKLGQCCRCFDAGTRFWETGAGSRWPRHHLFHRNTWSGEGGVNFQRMKRSSRYTLRSVCEVLQGGLVKHNCRLDLFNCSCPCLVIVYQVEGLYFPK